MNVAELRRAIEKLPPMKPMASYDRFTWKRRQAELREKLLNEDPSAFLTWPMIHEALFVGDAPWVMPELEALQENGWGRWKRGIKEVKLGKPTYMKAEESTSGNMVHQAYILKQWEDVAGTQVETLSSILEFGGGYGAMARLCNQLGFRGVHAIIDLPEFRLLQEYYLSQTKVSNAVFLPDSAVLGDMEFDLFIAACSLSEVPFELRDTILHTVKAKAYAILYQGFYMKRDNHGYFQKFMRERRKGMEWHNYQVRHWPAHWYLVGISA